MTRTMRWVAAWTLAAMASGAVAQTAVAPPTGGTVSIEPASGDAGMAMRPFRDAIAAALTARGFTILDDPGHAASVVELAVHRDDVGLGLAKPAGGRGPSMMGTGIAVPLGSGASQQVRLQRTRLEMRIRRRGGTALVWHGAAVTVREAGTRKGAPDTVAADLGAGLLRSYPVQPGDVVGVP